MCLYPESDVDVLTDKIQKVFEQAFGATPLDERVKDVMTQAVTLSRFRDVSHLKSETGDILCSVLQLCNECGWDPLELIDSTLQKIVNRTNIYKQLGRKLRVGLLSDAFDPVHSGHIALAQAALDAKAVDEMWFMPGFDQIGGSAQATASNRFKMCELAIQDRPGMHVFDFEIKHQFRGESYHLIKKLLGDSSYESRIAFAMIIDQDQAEDLLARPNGQQLERQLPFVVVPRAGGHPPVATAWFLAQPHRFCSALPVDIDSSSTQIRGMLANRDERAGTLLPENVMHYIHDHQLYTPQPQTISQQRIAIYSASFNPPTLAHREHVERLLDHGFQKVIIHPVGVQSEKAEYEYSSPRHRAAMVSLAFHDMGQVEIDYDDISLGTHSSLFDLQQSYDSTGEIWLVVSDWLASSRASDAASILVQRNGQQIWQAGRFVVLCDTDQPPDAAALPPTLRMLRVAACQPSHDLRTMVFHGQRIDHLLHEDVSDYVQRHHLFIPGALSSPLLRLRDPRLLIVHDERNAKAVAIAQRYQHYVSARPNAILAIGGDGTMLRAIRDQWRRRLPFIGLNSGHLGFLMNQRLPEDLQDLQLLSQSLPLLRVDTRDRQGRSAVHLAYGDTWLERAEGQAAWMRLDINGETMLEKIVGDGMLVATASGSSAYARAMGAAPVPIGSSTITIAGSNVFQPRFWRPMNLPLDSRITLTNLDTLGKRPLRAFADGESLGLVEEISVRQSLTAGVELAFTREFEPANKLLRSLFPPNQD